MVDHGIVTAMPHAEIATSFGAMLYQVRQQRHMSVAEASRQSGISSGYFSELENSKRKPPRHPIILKIAAGLELSTVQKERLIQLADEQRCADQFTKHLTPELRCLVLRICASALDLDLAAALALHAHLDRLSAHRSHSCDPGTGRVSDI